MKLEEAAQISNNMQADLEGVVVALGHALAGVVRAKLKVASLRAGGIDPMSVIELDGELVRFTERLDQDRITAGGLLKKAQVT